LACAGTLSAQNAVTGTNIRSAYVYVSTQSGIDGFSAAATGVLTPISGSPFSSTASYMTGNSRWLFGTDGIQIYSYSVAANGALQQVSQVNGEQENNPPNCGGPGTLFLDHTGASLYDGDYYSDCSNNAYQSWGLNQRTGALSYVGVTSDTTPNFGQPLSFLNNNQFAYGANCSHGSSLIFGFQRSSDGTLSDMNIEPAIPAAQQGGYCPYLAAADAAGNLAITLTPFDGYQQLGPPQVGVYTADSAGNLNTNSTWENMPSTTVGNVSDLKMSPSGRLLAVAGTAGVQVLHWNGANPATMYTPLLTSADVSQVFWDNANHLYALSQNSGQLFVFTVTPTGYGQASGSPHSITGAVNLAVIPSR
jgi:6-phosphogluconolactonase (cycloisomerase 2 family)